MTAIRWSYRVETVGQVDADELNEFGAEGWELMAVTPLDGSRTELIFKRPALDFRTRITLDQRADVTGDAGEATP